MHSLALNGSNPQTSAPPAGAMIHPAASDPEAAALAAQIESRHWPEIDEAIERGYLHLHQRCVATSAESGQEVARHNDACERWEELSHVRGRPYTVTLMSTPGALRASIFVARLRKCNPPFSSRFSAWGESQVQRLGRRYRSLSYYKWGDSSFSVDVWSESGPKVAMQLVHLLAEETERTN